MTAKKKDKKTTARTAKTAQPKPGLLDEARTAALRKLAVTPPKGGKKGAKATPAAPDATPPAVGQDGGIIREIAAKGKEARFAKHDRGLFVAGNKAQ